MDLRQLNEVLKFWNLDSNNYLAEATGKGHIHQTYILTAKTSVLQPKYVLQQLNTHVFKNPALIAQNWKLTAEYINTRFPDYLFLKYIPTKDGGDFAVICAETGNSVWRLLPFMVGKVFEKAPSAGVAFDAAYSFARFGNMLTNCTIAQFNETIPHFHDTNQRWVHFKQALENNSIERQNECALWIKKIFDYDWIVKKANALKKSLPIRVQHMDAKIGNLLFTDSIRQKSVLLDLDTIMSSNILSDVGDMIRSMACDAAEDEQDESLIILDRERLKAIKEGFKTAYGSNLSAIEKKQFLFAGQMMLHMQAVRFMTDYLQENKYYPVSYESQNVVRAANQLRLLEQLVQLKNG